MAGHRSFGVFGAILLVALFMTSIAPHHEPVPAAKKSFEPAGDGPVLYTVYYAADVRYDSVYEFSRKDGGRAGFLESRRIDLEPTRSVLIERLTLIGATIGMAGGTTPFIQVYLTPEQGEEVIGWDEVQAIRHPGPWIPSHARASA